MPGSSEIIGLVGVVFGVLLGFLGQLILARREEARQLDQARRDLYSQFLTAAKYALDHLAEGALNRNNGAIQRGAYSGIFLEDQQKLQAAISGMELISTTMVLTQAKQFLDAHWEFASREANAEPVDRSQIDDITFQRLGAEILEELKKLSSVNEAFIVTAQHELHISTLVNNRPKKNDDMKIA